MQSMGIEQPLPAPSVSPVGNPPGPFGPFAAHVDPVPERAAMPEAAAPRAGAQWAAPPTHVQKPRASPSVRGPRNPPPPPPAADPDVPEGGSDVIDVANTNLDTLADVVATAPPDAEQLRAAGNCICIVPRLSYFRNLTTVVLANNRIDTVERGAFHSMSALKHLDLQGNQLRALPNDALMGCSSLRVLNLRGNLLTHAPRLAKCSVAELLLDNNALEAVEAIPDDVGVDTWRSLRKLGLSGNKISNWIGLKGLAAIEGLEVLDVRRNPFHHTVCGLFNYRCFVAWLCPMLSTLDSAPVTEAELGEAMALFTDPATGHISDLALMLDDERQFQNLMGYLSQAIPPVGSRGVANAAQPGMGVPVTQPPAGAAAAAPRAGGEPAGADAPLRAKVKEMSQVVKVLHRHHLKQRADAARTVQAWWRGCTARQWAVPVAYKHKFSRFGVYAWPRRARAAQVDMEAVKEMVEEALAGRGEEAFGKRERSAEAATPRRAVPEWWAHAAKDRAVKTSRMEERRLRTSFRWSDNPARLHVSQCAPVHHPAGLARVAVVVQRLSRGFLVRNRVREMRLRYYAALTIQCSWRGYRTWALKHRQPEVFKAMVAARATDRVCRPQLAAMEDQIELLQNALRVLWNESRGMQAHFARVSHASAVTIQRRARGWLARRRYAHLYRSYLQYCDERGLPSRDELLQRDRGACITLQAVWRGARGRAACRELHVRQQERGEVAGLKAQVQLLFTMVQSLTERGVPAPDARNVSPPRHDKAEQWQNLPDTAALVVEKQELLHARRQGPLPPRRESAEEHPALAMKDFPVNTLHAREERDNARHERHDPAVHELVVQTRYAAPRLEERHAPPSYAAAAQKTAVAAPPPRDAAAAAWEGIDAEPPRAAAAAAALNPRERENASQALHEMRENVRIAGFGMGARRPQTGAVRGSLDAAAPSPGDVGESLADSSVCDAEESSTGLRRTLFRQSMSCGSQEDDSGLYVVDQAAQPPPQPALLGMPQDGVLNGSGADGSHRASDRYNTSKLDDSQMTDDDLLCGEESPGDVTRDPEEESQDGDDDDDDDHGGHYPPFARAHGAAAPVPDQGCYPDGCYAEDEDEDDGEAQEEGHGYAHLYRQQQQQQQDQDQAERAHLHEEHADEDLDGPEEDYEHDYAPDTARGYAAYDDHALDLDEEGGEGDDADDHDRYVDGYGEAAEGAGHDHDMAGSPDDAEDEDSAGVDADQIRVAMRERAGQRGAGLQFIHRGPTAATATCHTTGTSDVSTSVASVHTALRRDGGAPYDRWAAARGSDILPLAARAQTQLQREAPQQDALPAARASPTEDRRSHYRFNDLIAPPNRPPPAPPAELDLM